MRTTAYPHTLPGMAPVLLALLSFFIHQPVGAQEKTIAELRISINVKHRPFQEVLSIIEYRTPYTFAYGKAHVQEQKKASITAVNILFQDLLNILCQGACLADHINGQ